MADAYERCFALVVRALKERWSVGPAWREIISTAGGRQPSAIWKRIAKIEIARDIDRMSRWLEDCHVKEPPPKTIKGYWFGVSERSSGWVVELYGTKTYSTANSSDWAVDPIWIPKSKPFKSDVLKQLSKLRPRDNFGESYAIEMCGVFPFAALASAEAIRRVDPALLLGTLRKRGAACGFNDGDWVHLCAIESTRVTAVGR